MSAAASHRSQEAVPVGANPFSRWAVLAMVLLGGALFVALLWMIGTGTGLGSTNDGQAHVAGKGLNGYAALADYLDRRGFAVTRTRDQRALDQPGLLILTPPAGAEGKELDRIVSARRMIGPTLVIVPKWFAFPAVKGGDKNAKPGWVRLVGANGPNWPGFHDELTLVGGPEKGVKPPKGWKGAGLSAPLADPRVLIGGRGKGLMPLVQTSDERLVLAGYIDDGGDYPGLDMLAVDSPVGPRAGMDGLYPLVFVFEPDLLDNYGMARIENARLAEAIVRATGVEPGGSVAFDMTLNGFGRAQNLLTLAFTPPFLAATLCLLLAAVIVGWRAFLRFGPPLAPERAIAFGKRALVANAAGFVRRARRLHLIAGPYADRARERLVAGLALPRTLDPAATEKAIDRALAVRRPDMAPFSVTAAHLRAARRVPDLLKAARDLHALERTLLR